MSHYARGQETFTQKVTSNLNNLIGLIFFSMFCSLCSFCLLVYLRIPNSFWDEEKQFFRELLNFIKRNGPVYFPRAFNAVTAATVSNIEESSSVFIQNVWLSGAFGTLIFSLLFWFFHSRGKSIKDADYRRGSELIDAKEFNRQYKNLIKNELKEINKDNLNCNIKNASFEDFFGIPFKCSFDDIDLPAFVLFRHCAMIGTTGVGKSTLIKWYLEYCRSNGEKVIIPDINGEYAAEFFKEGDVILSLFDPKTAYWDFKSESIDPAEFAKFLVTSGDEHNKFWWKGARQVVSQLLERFNDPRDLWDKLNNEESNVIDHLTGLARKIAGKEGTTQSAGITGTSILDFGFLRYLNRWPESKKDTNPFSIFDWTQSNSSNWVFITFSDTDKEIITPLFKLWINTAITGLLKRTTNKIPLNIIIDELATLGKIELLPTALERGRKYGGKIILGYQSENQLLDVYGRDSAGSIKANTGTKFIFRCPEPSEAKELSDFLGRQEVIEKNLGTSFGAKNINDRENISERESLKNVVLDSEIRDLPDGHFFLKSLSINPVKSRIRKKRWEKIYVPVFSYPADQNQKVQNQEEITEKKLDFNLISNENIL